MGFAWPNYEDYRDRATSFESLACHQGKMYVQKPSRALDEFLDQADARLQYTLAYYSTHADAGRRDIRVTTMPPNIVQARTR